MTANLSSLARQRPDVMSRVSAYQLFMANERAVLNLEGWEGTLPQTMAEIARRWKALSYSDKQVWVLAAGEANR